MRRVQILNITEVARSNYFQGCYELLFVDQSNKYSLYRDLSYNHCSNVGDMNITTESKSYLFLEGNFNFPVELSFAQKDGLQLLSPIQIMT